jgi:hypothetical protein
MLQTETNSQNTRKRWIRFKDMPCSRMTAYRLIRDGLITTVKFVPVGSKKGIVLIDADSVDRYLERLAKEQGTLMPEPVTEGAK